MPNKYEREIEEILRNLERSQPKAGFGQRVGGRMRRSAGTRRSMPAIHLNFSEWCLIIAGAAALAAGGWAYANGGNLITGIIALVGLMCVALVALSSFLVERRSASSSTRYNNVTPLRSSPLRRLAASWHLLVLKLRYRNQRDRER
jgi:hypothetical protein